MEYDTQDSESTKITASSVRNIISEKSVLDRSNESTYTKNTTPSRTSATASLGRMAAFASHMAKSHADDFDVGDDEEADAYSGEDDDDDGGSYSADDESLYETGAEKLRRRMENYTTSEEPTAAATPTLETQALNGKVLKQVALQDEWQVVSCASLPFTVFFFMIFMLFFQQHYGVTDIFLTEARLRDELGTTAAEIAEPAGVHSWLEVLYIPYMWRAREAAGTAAARSQALYHELIAGVLLTTSRAKTVMCKGPLVDHLACFSGKDGGEDGDAFGTPWRRLASAHGAADAELGSRGRRRPGSRRPPWRRARRPVQRKPGRLRRPASGSPGGQSGNSLAASRRLRAMRFEVRKFLPDGGDGKHSRLVIPMSRSLASVEETLAYLRNITLIRDTSLTFTTQACVLNSQFGRELLTNVEIVFSFDRGGGVFAHVKIMTLVLDALYKNVLSMILGCCWVVCLIYFSWVLPARAYSRWKQGRFVAYCLRSWNLFEWAIIVTGWSIVLLFALERYYIGQVDGIIKDYQLRRHQLDPGDIERFEEDAVSELSAKVSEACSTSTWTTVAVADYHVLLVFRFFMAIRGQPRLAIILKTIRRASVDLFHLFIVFFIIFFAYTISGHILFGRRMHEFSTFEGALAENLQIVMERQYKWEKFTEQDLWTSTFWVWSFLLLVVLVLVNIFLAMIFDSYGEVRSSVVDGATVWGTTKHLLTQLKYNFFNCGDAETRWVPNRDLIATIQQKRCQVVTPWMLKDFFPGIASQQINHLFKLGRNRLENNKYSRSDKGALPEVVASILLGIEKMNDVFDALEAEISQGSPADGLAGVDRAGAPTRDSGYDKHSVEPAEEVPRWVKVQLMPHLQKQANILRQLHGQIEQIQEAMQERGLGIGVPSLDGPTVRQPTMAPPEPLGRTAPRGKALAGVRPWAGRPKPSAESPLPPDSAEDRPPDPHSVPAEPHLLKPFATCSSCASCRG